MIRSYASVFALFQGTVAIKKVGQDFQGMEASMLAASGSSKAAVKDTQFVSNIVDEMGLNLRDTTDAFVKFKFAAKGKMGQTEIEELFKGVSMFGTALKVAPEDMKRAQRAISQMMSKGVVMSEELKMQLGDALPGAVQVFAKALNMTEAELFKQMEQGKLLASEVLPKVAKAYKIAANEGGAYQLALQGLRVTEGQFATEAARAGKIIFNGGFEKGLSSLYLTMTNLLRDSGGELSKLGKAFKAFFKLVESTLTVATGLIKHVVNNIGLVTLGIVSATTAMIHFGNASAKAWARALLPITGVLTAVAAIDAYVASTDMSRLNAIEIGRGFQVDAEGNKIGIGKDKEGNYFSTGEVLGKYGENTKERIVSGTLGMSESLINRDLVGSGHKAYKYLSEMISPTSSTPQQIIQHNTFQVDSEEVYRNIQSKMFSGAYEGAAG
tara:strand:- start:890 stop:2209 length:1320 start_codon:yes stop_codon:yes gene_type:complete